MGTGHVTMCHVVCLTEDLPSVIKRQVLYGVRVTL